MLKKPPVSGNAGQTHGTGEKGPEGRRQALTQPPHTKDVLFMVHGGDDAAGAEEEEGLEEGVDQEMEGGGSDGAGADPEHHVADLADGGVGEDPLQVALGQAQVAA